MAGQTYNIDLQATDSTGSMKQRTKDAKEHNQELTKTQQLLKRQSEPRSRGVSAEYGVMRATGAGTGAAGRDFAKEAQGLSGLVRLYAIYAANIFAAEAAFRALSSAADTSNMIKGLDQLGSFSGVALGQLAKNLVKVSDGAISMRESMEAVAQASTAGLNPKQIMELGKVAKTASQALGRDMSDAFNRLSRGVVKLEPELLDELGLFTKIGPATEKYALSIGKSADQLTDFEKRQAFANAVIKEGLDKFSQLQIDINPYQQLLATLKDLSFKALDFLNGALTPVVKLLSSNPNALFVLLGSIAAMMVSKAIPAIGQYKQSLQNLTADAAKQAAIRVTDIRKAYAEEYAERKHAADAAAEIESNKYEKSLAQFEKYQKSARAKNKAGRSSQGDQFSQMDVTELTPGSKNLKELEELGKAQTAMGKIYRDQAEAAKAYHIQDEKYQAAKLAQIEAEKSREGYTTTKGQNEIITQRQLQALRTQELTSQANYTGSTLGASKAVKDLWAEVRKGMAGDTIRVFDVFDKDGKKTGETITEVIKKMSAMRGAGTMFKGTLLAVTGALATALTVAAPWLEVIGLIIAGLSIMDGWMDKASKSVKEFTDSQDALNSSSKTYSDTVNTMYKKDPSQVFNIQSLTAQATAIGSLSESFLDFNTKFQKAQTEVKMSWWSGAKDTLFSIFNSGIKDDFKNSMVNTIKETVKTIDAGSLDKSGLANIGKILNVEDPINHMGDLEKAIRKLEPGSVIFKQLGDELQRISKEGQKAGATQQAFSDALKKANTSVQGFMKQYTLNDPLTIMLLDQADALGKLDVALKKPIKESLSSLVESINSINENPMFGSDQLDSLRAMREEINEINKAYGAQSAEVKKLKDEQQTLEEANKKTKLGKVDEIFARTGPSALLFGDMKTYRENIDRMSQIRNDLKIVGTELDKTEKSAIEQQANMLKLLPKGLDNVAAKLAAKLGIELEKASNQYLQNIYAKIDVIPEYAKKAADLKVREMELNLQLINVNAELVKAMQKAPFEQKMFDAELQIKKMQTELQNRGSEMRPGEKANMEAQVELMRGTYTSSAMALGLTEMLQKNPNLASKVISKSGDQTYSEGLLAGAPILSPADKSTLLQNQATTAGIRLAQQQAQNAVSGAKVEKNIVDKTADAKFESLITEEKKKQIDLNYQLKEGNKTSLSYDILEIEKAKEKSTIDKARADYSQAEITINAENTRLLEYQAELEKKNGGVRDEAANKKIQELTTAKLLTAETQKNLSIQQAGQELILKQKTREFERDNNKRNFDLQMTTFQFEAEKAGYEQTVEMMKIKQSMGSASKDQLAIAERNNALNISEVELSRKQAEIDTKARNDRAKALFDLQVARTITKADYDTRIEQINKIADEEGAAAKRTATYRDELTKAQYQLNERGLGYLEIFNNTANAMVDGIIEFAKTGKMSFSDMVNNMITELVRLELRLMMFQQIQQTGGLVNMILALGGMSLPGMKTGGSVSVGNMGSYTPTNFDNIFAGAKLGPNALGNVYDQGLTKFAMGGIVNSPTLFKFAKGAGLMGEAGPEAIMPLKRSADGSLGVRGGSSDPVNVVVNNYGSEKATTKQTLDSRGRPQIEVTIGGMAAGQLAKPGSDMQQTMQNTYGQQPVLPRR